MKEPIYRIKVEVIGEEAEGHKIGETLRGGVDCNGFVILCNKEDSSDVVIHEVSNIDIATMIAPSGEMMAASLLAQAMCEGKKYLMKSRIPHVDLLKAMSK